MRRHDFSDFDHKNATVITNMPTGVIASDAWQHYSSAISASKSLAEESHASQEQSQDNRNLLTQRTFSVQSRDGPLGDDNWSYVCPCGDGQAKYNDCLKKSSDIKGSESGYTCNDDSKGSHGFDSSTWKANIATAGYECKFVKAVEGCMVSNNCLSKSSGKLWQDQCAKMMPGSGDKEIKKEDGTTCDHQCASSAFDRPFSLVLAATMPLLHLVLSTL
jgi:hypothetical protein